MNFWPFRRETRAGVYTDEIVALLQARASGESATGDPLAVGAAEIAQGLYGRSFATAEIVPLTPVTETITPAILEMIGRQLIAKGEALFLITVDDDGSVRLDPVAEWTISGRADPSSWRYEVSLAGPSVTTTMRGVSADKVIHVKYGVRPSEPWRGVGPLQSARLTALLTGNLEGRLAEETAMAVGSVMATPDGSPKAGLQADLRAMKGRLVLVDSAAGGWGAGSEQAPRRDMTAVRIGADPPPILDVLRSSAARHVLAACGVPIELVEVSPGTAAREAYRRFLHSSVSAVAKLVALELSDKLAVDGLTINFDSLMASDLSGRARAFGSLVTAGMDLAKAAALSGLIVPDAT